MALDYAESIVQLLANLVALLLCLFHYISVKQKGWAYGILFFLSSLLSSYYWTAYLVPARRSVPGWRAVSCANRA